MAMLDRRLRKLERMASMHEFSDWPIEDQIEDVLSALRVHRAGRSRQLATDRQIHLMGLLCAAGFLGEEGGEYTFPSGLTVTLTSGEAGDGALHSDAPSLIGVEDLPEGVREYFERMDPASQPERER